MEEAIRTFSTQFSFIPEIENRDRMPVWNPATGWRAVVGGMGGSHLAADIFKSVYPTIPVSVHSSYGLPPGIREGADLMFYIASSYSGNTEETIDFLNAAITAKKNCAAITTGGKLADIAREKKIPLVLMPQTGIQPRSALGFSLLALARLIGTDALLKEIKEMESLDPRAFEKDGNALADGLKGRVPVIYTSLKNQAIAYNWKIKFNETGKIPAFWNTFPELNHNELAGMDILPTTKELSERLFFIFIEDAEDHPRIVLRMSTTERLYAERGLATARMPLSGKNRLERVMSSLLLADWTALHTAYLYHAEPDKVEIIEKLKKLLG